MIRFAPLYLFLLTGCQLAPRVEMPPETHPQPSAPHAVAAISAFIDPFAILGFGVCVALAIWSPFKRTAIAGAAGFLSMILLNLALDVIRPLMPWIVLGFSVIGAGILLWYLRTHVNAIKQLASCDLDFSSNPTVKRLIDRYRK